MTTVDIVNAIEVVWWPLCGIVVLRKSIGASPVWRRLGLVAGICLILFGGSDVVELYTKAWWRPWWLFVWKALCITTLVACSVIRVRLLRRKI
jgi:hypothetical protein